MGNPIPEELRNRGRSEPVRLVDRGATSTMLPRGPERPDVEARVAEGDLKPLLPFVRTSYEASGP